MRRTSVHGYFVRRLTVADLPLLANVAAEVFDHPVHEKWSRAFLEDPNHVLVAAIEPGDDARLARVVGKATGMRQLAPDRARFEFFISEVDVSPPWRRQGLGRRMMATMFDAARGLDCDIAWLAVDHGNAPAIALYKNVGGVQDPQIHMDFDLATKGARRTEEKA